MIINFLFKPLFFRGQYSMQKKMKAHYKGKDLLEKS